MDPATMMLIGAGLGAVKNELMDKPQAAIANKLAATTARFSPWTHMTPGAIQQPNEGQAMLAGAGTGLAMQKGMAAPATSTTGAAALTAMPQMTAGGPGEGTTPDQLRSFFGTGPSQVAGMGYFNPRSGPWSNV